ncbi:hypothetical protein QBC32DRAFT_382633 [Pseudoneurospora amorphoporcata]|uniref:Uncharacterized protein n=1 Tax=Pseudoneurospora amorphoporcata TaxID=241081 RepID=A0AAN6SCA6_9PEZI|nr:hypothetical protein QBC32DRAFT_382633 [Pseudoneurospora amorphoporcata]
MSDLTDSNSTAGFGSFDLSPRKDWNSISDDALGSLTYPLQVRQLFESAVLRFPSSSATKNREYHIRHDSTIMDLPRELLYVVFDQIIAPFRQHHADHLVPESFKGKGIRFQVVEGSYSPKSPIHTNNLTVTGPASSRNLSQLTRVRHIVDPLQIYREIQDGTAWEIPSGWLESEEAAQEPERLSLNEDEIFEEDTDEYSDSSDSDASGDGTVDVGEKTAASTPRASGRPRQARCDPMFIMYDPDGVKRATRATNRPDGDGPASSTDKASTSDSDKGRSLMPASPLGSAPSSPLLTPTKTISKSSVPTTTEDQLEMDDAGDESDDQSSVYDYDEHRVYGFVMVSRPQHWETDEEIVALQPPRQCCLENPTPTARCCFRSPQQYQNLLRLSQLSPDVTKEPGKSLYYNCTAEFPYGPHLFPVFAAERPAILPMIRGIILHLECSADFNDTITAELAYMLSYFAPSLRPDSPCRKLAFIAVKIRTSLVDIPRWMREESFMEKKLIMKKLREWAPLFRAVDTDELVVSLVGIRDEVSAAAQGVRYSEGHDEYEFKVTTWEIRTMWRFAGLIETCWQHPDTHPASALERSEGFWNVNPVWMRQGMNWLH